MRGILAVVLVPIALAGGLARAQALTTTRLAVSLTRPVALTHAPGDFARVFICEQRGSAATAARADIKILNLSNNTINATPFLSINPVNTQSEQGLLGMAFHPNYAVNGYFYVDYTTGAGAGETVVARYRVSTTNPNVADPASFQYVLRITQPFVNHNGGWIGFGPDGYLYIAMGDGGSGNDPGNRAQTITDQLLGKMLRVDVDGDAFPTDPNRNYRIPPTNPFVGVTGDDEIWAYGLRNPWRDSFDRATGDLWIADVGQDLWEEIDFQPAGAAGGRNYGWRCMEGLHCTGLTGCTCNGPTLTMPIHEYDHSIHCSVTGGYVYRGCAIPSLDGHYFFADYCSGRIWSFRYNGTTITNFTDRTTELDPPGSQVISNIPSFGEDAYGEIYILDQSGGEVFKIVPAAAQGPDCNNNGRRDACDILDGTSQDLRGNGIPDECECLGDLDGDGFITGDDFTLFVTWFETGDPRADMDGDGFLTGDDFTLYVSYFEAGC